MNAVINLKWYR